MAEQAPAQFAPQDISLLAEKVAKATAEKAAAELKIEEAQEELYAAINKRYGEKNPVTLLWEHTVDKVKQWWKVGWYNQTRGAGTNLDALAVDLKKLLTPEHYQRLVVEEQVTTYHVNLSAVTAAGTLDPKVQALINKHTSDGVPTFTKINPQKAGKDLVKQADQAAQSSASAPTVIGKAG